MTEGFLANARVRFGLTIFVFFILVAAFGPQLVSLLGGLSPRQIDYAALHQPPSASHWFGTTSGGQDVLAQLVTGARGSIAVGVTSGVIATLLAILVGVPSGYLGGRYDQFMTLITNLFLTMPSFALLLIVAGYLQGATWLVIAILISIFEWPGGARYLRSQTLTLRNRDFAVAMKMVGEKPSRLIFFEILPHLIGIISAMFLRAVIAGIFAEAGLNFLGIGSVDTISWGTMIAVAQDQSAITRGYWWWFAPPGVCIALIGTATALINFGIDEITNPKLRAADRSLIKAFDKAQKKAATTPPRAGLSAGRTR